MFGTLLALDSRSITGIGGEPARLLITQWEEAVNRVWLRPQTRASYRNEMKTGNRITFQEGKGSRQIPIFFPPDIVDAMNFLCLPEARKESDIARNNRYVFPRLKAATTMYLGGTT